MLSFKFILLLFFGLFMQTVLATSYGLVSDVDTSRDDDNASQAPGNGFVTAVSDFGDDTTSENGLDEMTTGTSSVDTLPNRKPKGCWGMCSPSNMCLCRNKSVRVYCYCETPGKKCSCGRGALASREVIEVDATDTVVDEGTVTDVNVDGVDISDAATSDTVLSDAVPSDDATSEDIDSSDEDTSPISILLNKGKQQCHGKCTKCLGNCKDKYQCLCKGRDVVARCGCERLGEKCQCKGPWRAVRDILSDDVNINSTTADAVESAAPAVDEAADNLDGAAVPVPGVSLISDSELMESKPTTCHGVMCSKDGKCHCKHGPYNIVCPCHRLGAPCYCKNWRRDDDVSGSVDAAVAETVDTTPETPMADDNAPTPEDEDTEASSQPGFSHAVNDEFSTLQRTCYGTCSRKHKCSCRGKTCRCQIPGESCKCVFPFLPPRELESMPPFPGEEAEAEVDDTVITSPAPIGDIATPSVEDTVIPSDETTHETDPQEDTIETATSPIETENSPLVARGEPCWGVCDKYRHCYCGHIRTNCNCSKRGHRCYCASGPNDLPPGMGSGVTY